MTDEKKTPRIFKCPTCSKSTIYDVKNEYRPFCSPRCKDTDIIAWAEQNYSIAGKPPQSEDEYMELQEEIERTNK